MLFSKDYLIKLSLLGIVIGLLYNSWPLGYWLNPVVARSSLASGLEGVNQPYNWVFIGGDIASSLLAIILCWFLWRKLKTSELSKIIKIMLIFVVLFAAGTIIDALLPERCIPGYQVCPSLAHYHLLLYHGIFSILASVFLFVSLAVAWVLKPKDIVLNGLLLGYIIFGLISLFQALTPGKNGTWSQDYYITLCSVWLALIPYAIYKLPASFNKSRP